MNNGNKITIEDIPFNNRELLVPLLEKCFEGLYLGHAIKMLKEAKTVKAAVIQDILVGVIILEMLNPKAGYLYYIAIAPENRKKSIGKKMVNYSFKYFADKGAKEVFAVINEANESAKSFFEIQGFKHKIFYDLSQKYGRKTAIRMYHDMFVSWGEAVYSKEI